MISKKQTIIIVIIAVILSSTLTLAINDYWQVYQGDKVTISREDYQWLVSTSKLAEVKKTIESQFALPYDESKLMDGAVKGLVAALGDPYSQYFDKDEYKEFMEHTTGKYAGVGLLVTVNPDDNLIEVVNAFKDGPAAKAGIKPGDKVVKVDGQDVDGSSLDKAVAMMKGDKGTKVKVTILREGSAQLLEFELVRDIINIQTIEYSMMDGGIGYIRLTTFDQGSVKEFDAALNALSKQGMKGLIFDLRDNPGGLLDVAVEIADRLMPKGLIVYTMDKNGEKQSWSSDANKIDVPLVILVNENSASASEVVSGAVQDSGSGTLVGTKTFGKGIVQSIRDFKDGSALKLTTSKYYTPKGRNIHGTGIQPDVVVEMPEGYQSSLQIKPEDDTQLQKAVEVLKSKIK
ncbi:S41 family peptidase [Mahella australiensis]|uniref:Carboxyl-terminal protease n=1 Tax=Mahella australiensis (strain DSM 15567 / CIP 107919 / 50-1 BON) TaxID=697281 RepID=F4A097_MAHA5|nr:S41 family peptidase [Mahella australiensis]AEE96931.1 carboxyl-terminal protease [Mahella australiensis 50-1 BON]